jgi:pimeloyl-ACP methyl ester carboxylesterase
MASRTTERGTALLYVHGLWMSGGESVLLRRRLAREHGYRMQIFRYASRSTPIDSLAASLRETIAQIDAPRVHLVGHSMGGLVILRCLERYPLSQPGRVVLLGTPTVGSRAARHIGQWRWGRRLVGVAVAQELLTEHRRRWSGERDLGIIAGTLPVGLAALLVKFEEDNDGVVAVSETRLPGATEYLRLRASHSGMLLSARVAREVGSFLEHGRFGR